MRRTQNDIVDLAEAMRTIDLKPCEITEIEKRLNQLAEEWNELESRAVVLRLQRRHWVQLVVVLLNDSTTPIQDTVVQIDAGLTEMHEQMSKTENDLVDLGEAMGIMDLEPGERTLIQERLDQLAEEWGELESKAVVLRAQRRHWMKLVMVRQNGSTTTTAPIQDAVAQIDAGLNEIQEQMSKMEKDIVDLTEAMETIDLEPGERTGIQERLDQLAEEWKELESKGVALRSQRHHLMQPAMVLGSSNKTIPIQDTVAQIDGELTEIQEQVSKMEKDIVDLAEAMETIDLEPGERTGIQERLDQLAEEWKELENEAVALRSQRRHWVHLARQNGTEIPGTSSQS